jgi:hypothetical protein
MVLAEHGGVKVRTKKGRASVQGMAVPMEDRRDEVSSRSGT